MSAMLAVLFATLGGIVVGLVQRFFHGRAMITAEQKGRVGEIERQRAAADAKAKSLAAAQATLDAIGAANEAAAVAAVPTGRVERSNVERWQIPPKGGKPS